MKLVIGVGSLLRCDDGVGIHVVNRINELTQDIEAIDLGTGSIDLLEAMQGYETVIIVDAIMTGGDAGTIYRVNLSKGEKPPVVTHSHGIDLLTTLQLGKELMPEEMPENMILLAVEAEDVTTLQDTCTEKVQDSIKDVIEIIKEILCTEE